MLLSLLTASSLAFAPNLVPVSQPSLAAMRSSTISASVIEGLSTRRAALFSAGGAAAAAFLPAAALALTDEETKAIYDAEKAKYKKTAEAEQNKESDTFKLVAVISLIVLVSPIIGIQSARTAISNIVDKDDMEYKANDPRSKNFQRRL